MAAGTGRYYTLQDVLGELTGNSQASSVATTITGVGVIAEADESSTSSDTVTAYAQTPGTWDQAQWGGVSWG